MITHHLFQRFSLQAVNPWYTIEAIRKDKQLDCLIDKGC